MANTVPADWFAAIVESSEDAVIVIDPDRTIRFANAAAIAFGSRSGVSALVGAKIDHILEQSLILDEEGNTASPETYPCNITLREGKEVRDRVFQQIIPGSYVWIKASSFPILDEQGRLAFVIVRFADISQIRFQQNKLEFLIKASKVYPINVDVEERLTQKARVTVPLIADWCMVSVVRDDGSIGLASIVHRDPEKMSLLNEFVKRTDSGKPDRGIRHVIETGVPEFYPDITEEFLGKILRNSEEISVALKLGLTSAMILPIISRGAVLGVLSLGYAESKRKYTADDFAFMQEYCSHISVLFENAHLYGELQKQAESKDSFLATLSHELRNPLAPIKSMLELMKMQAHSAELRRSISVIEHQFDHLTKILTDLLEVNRYARGKIHVELRRVNLLTVMHNSMDSAKPFFRKKDIELAVSLPQHAIVIRADRTRLEQALMNVLHNAEKFTPVGGRIEVAVTADDKLATITISDNGIGIESDMLANIFEPGVRDKSAAHKTEGLGLGLVLVKDIVELHGGKLVAKSEGPGKGSQFIITLPILQQQLL